jgi:Na+-transporting NADH:ubiquinone oxidoreductase subunit A
MPHINIKKGHDLQISGLPDKTIQQQIKSETVAILPTDFRGIKPKLIVKEGDKVKIGSPLFFNKVNPDIKWGSPACGTVKTIEYGPRRVIQKIEIQLSDSQESEKNKKYKNSEIIGLDREVAIDTILGANIFPFFRQRPFNIIPDPKVIPRDIFVSAINTAPLAFDQEVVIKENLDSFQAGVDALNTLTSGKVYLTSKTGSVVSSIQNVEAYTIDGPHPAGNVGIQIHHISHLKPGENVWTINSQDVITIGKLFLRGIYDPTRVITLAGPCIKEPGHFRINAGAKISTITNGRMINDEKRIISGDVLTGRVTSPEDFISFYDYSISVISDEVKREFIGMLNPGSSSSRYSLTPVFLSLSKLLYPFNTSQNGSHRAVVPINAWERVLPMDILPNELYRSILAKDIDEMEMLGLLECDDEDFALCSFACPSKTDVSGVIREGLDILQAEG